MSVLPRRPDQAKRRFGKETGHRRIYLPEHRRFAPRSGRLVAVFLIATGIPTAVLAQAGQIVEFLYPQGGQAETNVEVTVEGVFLSEPHEVLFYQPGIRCTKMEPLDTRLDTNTGQLKKVQPGSSVKLTFEIARDARPGEYQLRLRTRDALSEMVTFWVTPFPIVHEQHAWQEKDGARNDSAEHAQNLPRNCTVSGFLPGYQPQDNDWFSVDCKQGEHLSVEVVAARLGTLHYGGLNDPAISIFDSAGVELGRNDDNGLYSQDPVLSVIVPRDGRYFIHMRQQMDYEAGRLRHYLMHVGSFARPLVAFPLGGEASSAISVTLLGDAAGPQKTTVQLPSEPGLFEATFIDAPLRGEDGTPSAPSANRVHVAPFGDVFERPGHNSPDNPQQVETELPVALNGRIESEGEVDWFRFSARKGERFRVFGYGKTLDSELDPRIWIRPAPGNPSRKTYDEDDSRWEPHDLVGHHYRHQQKLRLDPVFMFEPDTDGEWLIGIGDTRREFGPHHIYRIEFQPHVDSAFVHFPAYPSTPTIIRDRVTLFPGRSLLRPVTVQPGFGSKYGGLLQLRAEGLPKGVSMECRPFRQSDGIIPVLFTTEENAKAGAVLVDLIVEPVDRTARANFRGGFIQNNQATNRRGDYAMYFNRTRKMALAVVEGAPFNIRLEKPSVPLVRNGELALKVSVDREPGFDGAVYCEMDWLPPGVNRQPPLIIPSGKTEATYKLRAAGNAAPGEYPLSITARENEGGNPRTAAGFHYVCSRSVPLTVGEPYVTVELLRAAIERGKTGTITAEVAHHRPFDGKARLELGRLPFGVKQVKPFPQITADSKTATFQVEVTADCLVGQYRDIYCEVIVDVGGQTIRQQTGSGLLRVDPERKAAR